MGRVASRTIMCSAAGALAGLVVALGVALTRSAAAHGETSSDRDPAGLIEAAHLPPLLTVKGEPVVLRYDIYCAPPGGDPESGAPCDGGGTVYVRAGDAGPFRALPLLLDTTASEGRYAADVPADIAGSHDGFSYYAVLRSNTSGAVSVVPAGGATAPQRSRPLGKPALVQLGEHAFGVPARAAARVASAAWGSGDADVGLEPGPGLQPIGGSSFDVGATGTVSLLDEANHRVLRFSPGFSKPVPLRVDVRGTMADLAVGSGGEMTILETVGDDGATPLVRRFDAAGKLLGSLHLAERSASALELGPAGPVALEYPAAQWMPVSDTVAGGAPAGQRARGRAGRPLADGDELVVQRAGNEVRIAQAGPRGVKRSWRIQSSTPLGEIQLANVLGDKVVVVVRVYTDLRDEFLVLVLGEKGLVSRFAIDSAAWAETAPLARFRLRGTALYTLGSTSAGIFVDRYDLEVG